MKTLVLGSSPNAWSAALNLVASGHSVQVVECAQHVGAPYVTANGRELGLADLHFGGELAVPTLQHTGRSIVENDQIVLRATRQGLEGSQLSARDAERWPQFVQLFDQASQLLGQLFSQSAPSAEIHEAWRALGRRTSMEVLRLPWMSLRDLLDEWFENESLKGMLAEVALEGIVQGPFACGTVYHLLTRWTRGDALHPATAAGGSSTLIQALQEKALHQGVAFQHCPGQPELVWESGRPTALQIGDARFELDTLVSDKDARWTYTQLVSPRYLETEFNNAIHKIRGRGVWQRGSGQAQWPDHWPLQSQQDVLHIHPGLRALEKAYDRVKRQQTPENPPLQICWPGLLDSQRPADLLQLTWGYGGAEASPKLPWLTKKTISVRGPQAFEREWLCPEGHLWGGQHDLSQSFFLRPVPAFESGLDEVQLCGASLHPGDYSGRSASALKIAVSR